MQQLEALAQQDPPFRCSPKDLEQAVQQLGKLSSEDGSLLIEYVVTLCDAYIQPEVVQPEVVHPTSEGGYVHAYF